jgi:hypothetical protein
MTSLNQLGFNQNSGQLTLSLPVNPVIEALDGPAVVDSLMGRFPEAVYAKGRDTHLYKFLLALCGDAGAASLKKATLLARLKNEGSLLNFNDIDNFYGKVLGFERLSDEIYIYDPKDNALEKEVWDKIHAMDSSYRKRIVEYLQSTRYGNAPRGIELAARAASGIDCEVVENYKYVYDLYSDDRLNITKVGNTDQTEEFVIVPRAIDNRSNVDQKIAINLTGATGGTFTIDYSGLDAIITYGDSADKVRETLVTSLSDLLTSYEEVISADGNVIIVEQSISVNLFRNNSVVVASPNANSYEIIIKDANIDVFNFTVDGTGLTGPDPDITISYPLNAKYYIANFSGPMQNYYDKLKRGEAIGPGDHDFEIGTTLLLRPDIEKNIVKTVDKLRPVSSMMTVKTFSDRHIKVSVNKVQASSERINLTRFVTGKANVSYPLIDPKTGSFIQNAIQTDEGVLDVESEATAIAYSARAIPIIYHTIQNVIAYTDEALFDPEYDTGSFTGGDNPAWIKYRSITFAPYSNYMNQRFNSLVSVIKDDDIFWDYYAVARPDTPFILGANPYA